jgi:branched-chain amino acid transport system ATP-binding protein
VTVASAPLLVADDVVAGYVPGLPIVHRVSLQVAPGEVLVVLGPNGAGKSTLVKALAGTCPRFGGRVHLGGDDVSALPAHRLAAAGIGFVPQTANIFTTMSVDENLRVGGHLLPRALLRRRVDEAFARFPDLAAKRRQPGHALSGGQRQMLAVARALIMAPRVLMLDEPSAGLSPLMVGQVFREVRAIADSGIAVLMVEQNVKAGLAIADRGIVLVGGRIAHEGSAASLQGNTRLAELYLGRHAAPAARPSA